MRNITIIGAGHAGLQLGIGLLGQGHSVTIISNRTADEIAQGRITSSQSMYNLAVSQEREQGLLFWDDTCPPLEGMHVRAGNADAGVMLDFKTRMPAGQSVDQRLKMPRWMNEFDRRGGKLLIQEVDLEAAERLGAQSDLLLVATGKGELGKLFERDTARCQFDAPQRITALTYVHGMKQREDFGAVNINVNPGIGELVHFPGLTHTGPCDIINIESIIGGPMDRWDSVKTPEQHLALTLELIREFFPWEAPRFANVRLTDDNGVLFGGVTPTVRKPVGTLPSGRPVLGIGDIHVLNDPMTGQGSNNASKGATMLLQAIAQRGERPFDRAWMQQVAESNWDSAQWSARLTNTMLTPPNHVLNILGACQGSTKLAQKLAAGFNDPRTMANWYFDEQGANRMIEACSEGMAEV